MGHKPDRKARRKRREREAEAGRSFADELRQNSAAAPERKRREDAEKEDARRARFAEDLYTRSRDEAKRASDAGERTTHAGTGFTPGYVSAEDERILETVMERLRAEDKLRVKLGTSTTKHTSDDTGEDFTRDHVIFIISW